MFGKRKDAGGSTQVLERPASAVVELPTDQPSASSGRFGAPVAGSSATLTLSTQCVCGHARRDHRGLRMETAGACLECDCARFSREGEMHESREQAMQRILAALDRVELMHEAVERLRTQKHETRRQRP